MAESKYIIIILLFFFIFQLIQIGLGTYPQLTPSVNLLARELNSVHNRWFELGTHLDVSYSDLQEIKQNISTAGTGELMIHMLDKLHRYNRHSLWISIIAALRIIKETKLADDLEAKYIITDHQLHPDSSGKFSVLYN